MDYSNKILLRDYLEKMDKIYQRQSMLSKQFQILRSILFTNPIRELYDFPELFTSEEEYDSFFEGVQPDKSEEQNFDKIEQLLYTILFSQTGKFPLRAKVNTFDDNLAYYQMRHDLAEHQAKALRDFVEKRQQRWTNTHTQLYTKDSINSKVDSQQKFLRDVVEGQLRQKDNSLRHIIEVNKPLKERKRFKQWVWTPNPNTRHPLMADVVVPIDEPFHVISTQSRCPDCEMDHPLDITAPACQVIRCKCFPVYTNDRDAL